MAKTYRLAYGEKFLEFSDDKVIFCATTKHISTLPDPVQLIDDALDTPYGTPPLERIVKPGDRVALIVDDITRPTPRRLLLDRVTKRLETIPQLSISIILALGTHRPMSAEEIAEDLGPFSERYPVVNISYLDKERFAVAGEMPNGTPIHVYKEVLEADVVVGIGNIVPHIAAGWGGGAKIIMPGVCGKETTDAIHMLSCTCQNVLETCGSVDNLFRRTMEALAKKVGLAFIINTVLDEEKNLRGVFCGDFVKAHRAGVDFARGILCPSIPQRADIVIVSANPANADFWQGAKPYVFAHFAVKRGGVIILLLSAEYGLCGCAPAHRQALLKYYNKSEADILQALAEEETTDILGLGEAFIRMQTEGFCKTLLISEGLGKDEAALLGFELVDDLEEAVQRARHLVGANATIGLIPHGGELLCVASNEN